MADSQVSNAKFRADIAKWIAKSKAAQDMYVQTVILSIDQRFVFKSPVDTSRFKNNWNIGNGTPDFSTSEILDKNITQSRSAKQIFSIKANGQTIFVTNALPYAYRIEYEGWSKKVPNGVVRTTIAEMATILRQSAFEVKAIV